MKNVFSILFAIFLSMTLLGCAVGHKHDPWTVGDHMLYTTALALHGADWLHTRAGVGKYGLQESNIIMGKSPNEATIDLYFASTAAGLTAVTLYTRKEWRRSILIGWGVIELVSVMHNQTLGVQLTF